ncbi:NACHT domain-containing protein [Streptomyces sp. AN091965]|uniref:NACHT domain-containing protein n=1 Tax=Streptomyces sp. AN091965 TaxID=2927803 RepID=UPI001F610772|nr:NACHT domain-containing protein [Streptomyces sp. AN091965]MCI3928778.1 NACHT domain-containing protein [Streptomyces sp. AN091965]
MGASEDGTEPLADLKGRLRNLRARRRLSMITLSRRAGLGRTTVSQALNGTGVPSDATVAALAAALGADPEELLRLRDRAVPPPAPVEAPAADGSRGAEERFEAWYRSYVAHRYGKLSVIGLDLSRPERNCWPLDAAYLSLEFATLTHGLPPGALAGGRVDGAAVSVERAEQALAGRPRTLVRGLAGSGKTTLVQWLAVATARRELPVELAHLTDRLPFVLPLRTLVRRGRLPAPHEYLAATGCPREGAQPPGWADRVLLDGRGLLLVDGLDEVPQAQRARTRQWLHELLAAYPRAAYVVTTRPSAVPEGWLADGGFAELTVRPMGGRDVAVFVTRWHDAAAADLASPQERAHLAALGESLKDTVRSQRELSRLTATPLLCALVCALHRDRRGHLPHGRMELYDAALSMLLHRRDRERDIDAPEGLCLTEHQSVQILQRLAYWLIRNGQDELDQDTAVDLIGDALPAMPHVGRQADARGVLTHLLARSGLLRRPSADTVDFIHRTFQDYLGAKAAVEARDLPLLVRNAHDDRWEDVLRMAVAHARPAERATLLRRLIARGDRVAKHRVRLHLLATACLEYATELDPAVREDVRRRTEGLLPPRSRAEAAVLAEAGPVILDLLPGPEGLEDDEAKAVVLTAGRIGGDAALTVMKRFRASAVDGVRTALEASWHSFDASDYAQEVLSHLPGFDLLPIRSVEQLAVLRTLAAPRSISIQGDFPGRDIAEAVTPEKLRWLNIARNSELRDVEFLRALPCLNHVGLINCSNLANFSALAHTDITGFYLGGERTQLLEVLRHLPKVGYLGLNVDLKPGDLRTLPIHAGLTDLMLGRRARTGLDTLDGIDRWANLSTLNLCDAFEGIHLVASLGHLNRLMLQTESGLAMLAQLPPSPQIRSLMLNGAEGVDDLACVRTALPNLTTLEIHCWNRHCNVDLTALRGMPDLTVTIDDADEVIGTEHFPPGAVTRYPRPRTNPRSTPRTTSGCSSQGS